MKDIKRIDCRSVIIFTRGVTEAQILIFLDSLVSSKGWKDKRNLREEPIVDCLFSLINAVEGSFLPILKELLHNYTWISSIDRECHQIAADIKRRFEKKKKILLVPIMTAKNEVKSGHSVVYHLKALLSANGFKELSTASSESAVQQKFSGHEVIIVDDFIGSGSQVKKFVKTLTATGNIQKSDLSLYCIASLKKFHSRYSDIVGYFHSSHNLSSAFSGDIAFPSLSAEQARSLYTSEEEKLSIRPYYRLGYLKSEGLVSMLRTPNNCLPIFWNSKAKHGVDWPAPFVS